MSLKSQQDQDNNNLSQNSTEKLLDNVVSEPVTKVPSLDLSKVPNVKDNYHVTSDSVIEETPASKTPQEIVKVRNDSPSEDEEPTVVNFGPKEVSEEMYGRDFYVQAEKKTSPRHWEVKLPQYSPRGGRVMHPEELHETEEEVSMRKFYWFLFFWVGGGCRDSLLVQVHSLRGSFSCDMKYHVCNKKNCNELI